MEGLLLEAVQQLGLPVVIAVVFIVDGRAREKRLLERLDTVQDRAVDRLAEVVSRNTEAFAQFTEVARKCGKSRE